jgi:ADP-heptose:LPS heptosyltransferase
VPYLQAPVAVPAELLLPQTGRRRIGLVWAGSPDNRMDRRRSIAAATFAPLLDAVAADFVSLQVGPQAAEAGGLAGLVWAAEDKVRDFADTAAVIGQLDLVIGVDTAVLHLTGALAKPAWILLPFAPDYRWLLSQADTPWYPTARLFRQPHPGDWPGVIAAVTRALTSW